MLFCFDMVIGVDWWGIDGYIRRGRRVGVFFSYVVGVGDLALFYSI